MLHSWLSDSVPIAAKGAWHLAAAAGLDEAGIIPLTIALAVTLQLCSVAASDSATTAQVLQATGPERVRLATTGLHITSAHGPRANRQDKEKGIPEPCFAADAATILLFSFSFLCFTVFSSACLFSAV